MDSLSFRKKQLDSLFKTINLICKEDDVPKEEKLKQAEELIQKLIQMKSETMLDLEARKADQGYFNACLRCRYNWDRIGNLVNYERATLHCMRQALDELQQSTPEDKYKMFHKLCQQIQHGNNNLVEERRILRAIQHAKEQSEKPSSSANGRKRWIHNSRSGYYIPIPNSVEQIEDKIEFTLSELKELQRKQKPIIAYEKKLKKGLEKSERDVCLIRKQLDVINKNKRLLYAYLGLNGHIDCLT